MHAPPAIDDVARNIRNDQAVRPDPNPAIDCSECEESFKFQDYWDERYVSGKSWNPNKVRWICDDCLEEMYEQYRLYKRRENHKTLTEWSE